jgi:hypothetical protein
MSFTQQLIIVMADKLVIGIAIIFVGYIFNSRLKAIENKQMLAKEIRDLQVQKELQATAQIAAARLPAYKTLWEQQEQFSPTLHSDLTVPQRKDLEAKLRTWYYKDGNGIFLSHAAITSYRTALECLMKEGEQTIVIKDAFSSLRTQLKEDMRIYNSEEAKAPTGP